VNQLLIWAVNLHFAKVFLGKLWMSFVSGRTIGVEGIDTKVLRGVPGVVLAEQG